MIAGGGAAGGTLRRKLSRSLAPLPALSFRFYFIALKAMSRTYLLLLILLLLLLPFESLFAQHKILLISGKTIEAESYIVGDMFVSYKKQGDKRSGTRAVDRYDVFSITNASGEEELLYAPADSLDFTVDEARLYIQGEQVAREYYNSKGASISSAIIGAGSSILYFYALPIPMIYSVVLGRFNPKKMHLPENFNQEVAHTEAFKLGYQKSARNIKIQKSLKWGYIGLGAGLAGWIVYGVSNH